MEVFYEDHEPMCIICFATHTSISILTISIEKTTTICPVREHGKSTKPYISPQYFHVCVVHEVLTLLIVADTGPYYMLLHCKYSFLSATCLDIQKE